MITMCQISYIYIYYNNLEHSSATFEHDLRGKWLCEWTVDNKS